MQLMQRLLGERFWAWLLLASALFLVRGAGAQVALSAYDSLFVRRLGVPVPSALMM